MEHAERFQHAAFELAVAAGNVANYCDHSEHNEVVDAGWVIGSGSSLLRVGLQIATLLDVDAIEQYAKRLTQIESANVLDGLSEFEGGRAVREARTWRDLQRVQARHDLTFHPDVAGLSRADQLRHYAFHVAKLAAALAACCLNGSIDEEIRERRMPDLILFGIKLHTVVMAKLPDSPIVDGWD